MENNLLENISCSLCHTQLLLTWYYCPNCGKIIKEKPLEISLTKQITIYFVSFFLAPLGLGWGFKYVKSSDTKVRTIGIISIALTIISIAIMFFVFKGVIDQYAKIINGVSLPGNSGSLNNLNINSINSELNLLK